MGMAIDVGIGGRCLPATPGAGDGKISHPDSLLAQRTWLACFLGPSSLLIGIRRGDANAQWTAHHDNCLDNLSTMASPPQTDRLFLHIIRGERLCFQIATSLALCDPTSLWDITTEELQRVMSSFRKDIDDWTAEISPDFDHKPLLIYRYSAIIYFNEPVLHTPTNKLTFGAPLRLEKIAESDFANPVAIGNHVAALYALKSSCHTMLDLAVDSTTRAFLATCPLPYIAKVFYALFILVKLYVSVTAPGNTFGTILRSTKLHLEQYLERFKLLTEEIERSNPGSYNARILACHSMLDQ